MRKTVLIVKDNASLRHRLCELFKCKGDFDVCEVAENGPEAIEVKGRLHPDLNCAGSFDAGDRWPRYSPDLVQCP